MEQYQKNPIGKFVIGLIIGIAVMGGGFYGMNYLISKKEAPPRKEENNRRKGVSAQPVANGAVATTLDIQGRLQAFNKIGLFSEVTGTLKATGRPFKVGTYFPKGAPLLKIDDEENRLALQAQKATLLNMVAMMMPDLKIDYPESFPAWQKYLDDFSVDASIQPLPAPKNQAEKLFVAGRNLYTQYYTIKGQEERLTKFTIYAPFSGVLTQANIDVGAVVRTGQQIGELMANGSYELVASVPLSQLDYLSVGNKVQLSSEDLAGTWSGKIKRISDQIDAGSQTVNVFIGVSGKGLREGMYLRGQATATTIQNALEIDRDLLIDQQSVFVLEADSIVRLHPVQVVKFNQETVVIRGLGDGTELIDNVPAGAFDGMLVRKTEAPEKQVEAVEPLTEKL